MAKIRPLLRLKTEQADLILEWEEYIRRSRKAAALQEEDQSGKCKGTIACPRCGRSLAKTQQSFLREQQTYSGTWPRAGMTRNGIAYRRQRWRPHLRYRVFVVAYACASDSWDLLAKQTPEEWMAQRTVVLREE